MALTKKQTDTFQKWLNNKAPAHNCGMCGANKWALGDIIQPPVRTGDEIALGGPSIPAVMLICGNCAHIELFAAVKVGLL